MSIRTVQTSFTSASAFEHSAWSTLTSPISTRVLAEVDLNYPRPNYSIPAKKLPPGLGYYAMPSAVESSSALPSQSGSRSRRRSGGYQYGSTGDKRSLVPDFIPMSGSPVVVPPQAPKRRFSFSRSLPCSSNYKFSSPPIPPSGPIKFDPFGSDECTETTPSHHNTYNQHNSQYSFPANFNIASSNRKSSLATPSHLTYNIKLPSTASSVSLPLNTSTIPVALPLPKPDRNARSKLVAGILLNRIYAVGKPMRKRLPFGTEKEYVKSNLSRVVSVDC